MPGKLGGDLLDCFSIHGAILDVFSGTEGIEADVLRVVRRVDVLLHAAETDDPPQKHRERLSQTCVGSMQPLSNIAHSHVVQARLWR